MLQPQVDYWKLQETKRHNLATEEIERQNAATNVRNADTNVYNAGVNQQNADTNVENARINAQNAMTNARNAEVNAWNASINEANSKINKQNANTNERNQLYQSEVQSSEKRLNEARIGEAAASEAEKKALAAYHEAQTGEVQSKKHLNETEAKYTGFKVITGGTGDVLSGAGNLLRGVNAGKTKQWR